MKYVLGIYSFCTVMVVSIRIVFVFTANLLPEFGSDSSIPFLFSLLFVPQLKGRVGDATTTVRGTSNVHRV